MSVYVIALRESTVASLIVNYMLSTTKKPLCLQRASLSKPPLWQLLDVSQVERSIKSRLGTQPQTISSELRHSTWYTGVNCLVACNFFFSIAFSHCCFCKQGCLDSTVNTCVLRNIVCDQNTCWGGYLQLQVCLSTDWQSVLSHRSMIFYQFTLFNLWATLCVVLVFFFLLILHSKAGPDLETVSRCSSCCHFDFGCQGKRARKLPNNDAKWHHYFTEQRWRHQRWDP